MFVVAPISSRNEFGKLCTSRRLTGTAVEVGTHQGQFADVFLRNWGGEVLRCVDPWDIPPGYESQAEHLPDRGETRSDDFNRAKLRLDKHRGRVEFWKMTSEDALAKARDSSVDFVYVDGDHSYAGVRADLFGWWPKIRPGGILAGHDIVCPGEVRGGHGRFVQAALADFVLTLPPGRDTIVQLVVEENGLPWSFYLEKSY